MTRAATPDRRHAFLVRTRPLPTFRVRSASGEPAHLVVLQLDGSLTCNCTAASFGSRSCAHRRIATRSIERRTGWRRRGDGWQPPTGPSGEGIRPGTPVLTVLQGGRSLDVDAAWGAVS